jgi:acetyl esterase/lipase
VRAAELICTRGAALLLCLLLAPLTVQAQREMPLYAGEIPNSSAAPDEEATRDSKEPYLFRLNVSRPTVTVYEPHLRDTKHAAVIILPGGSYRGVSIVKEGHDVARAFNELGITAFVLKYRTPSERHMLDKTRGPLQDAQQAVHMVRDRADEWHIDRMRIGVVGFSAGGHLAATVATQFDQPVLPQWRSINLRPDFLILVYPVVSFSDDLAHQTSREQLLGAAPALDLIRHYSNELNVTARTPPAFLVHAADDAAVPVGNSMRFAEALQAHHVPVELIVYPSGGHGFGLNNATTRDRWIDRCAQWLEDQGWTSGQREKIE